MWHLGLHDIEVPLGHSLCYIKQPLVFMEGASLLPMAELKIRSPSHSGVFGDCNLG